MYNTAIDKVLGLSFVFFLNSVASAITITSPMNGSTVSGKAPIKVSVSRWASRVQYFIDSKSIASVTTAPFSYSWDSTNVANRSYFLTVMALSGNRPRRLGLSPDTPGLAR